MISNHHMWPEVAGGKTRLSGNANCPCRRLIMRVMCDKKRRKGLINLSHWSEGALLESIIKTKSPQALRVSGHTSKIHEYVACPPLFILIYRTLSEFYKVYNAFIPYILFPCLQKYIYNLLHVRILILCIEKTNIMTTD